MAIQGAIFKLRAQIAFKLQDPVYQTSSLIEFRRILVDQMAYKVEQLNRESFEELEIIRENLRGLMKYVPTNSGARYYTNFDEEILTTVDLDARQIYFVYQIIEYIVHNGVLKDMTVLQEPPFSDRGSIVDVFADVSIWFQIRKIIEQINVNAVA